MANHQWKWLTLTPFRRIVATANGFLSFLSGYSIFQGSVVGIMIVDYFLIRRGNLHIRDMYTTSPDGRYHYFYGVNICSIIAFIVGFALPMPGFIGIFGTTTVSDEATHMFYLGWVLSFAAGAVSYWVTRTLTARSELREYRYLKFEQLVPQSIDTGDAHDCLIIDGEVIIGSPVHHDASASIRSADNGVEPKVGPGATYKESV